MMPTFKNRFCRRVAALGTGVNMWVFRQRPIYMIILASVVYWTFAPMFSRDLLFQMLNAVAMCLAAAVAVTFSPSWMPSLFKKELSPPEQFLLAFGLLSSFNACIRVWSLIWRVKTDTNFPPPNDDMLFSLTLGFFIYGSMITYTMFLMTPGAVYFIPRMRWILTGAAVGLGLFGGAVMFILLNQ